MKKLIMLALLLGMTANTAFATSYWFDYCHSEETALAQAKKDYPNLNFNGDCDSISELGKPAVFTGLTAICDPNLTKVSFKGIGRAHFKVRVLDPDTKTILSYHIVMRSKGGGCKLTKIVELI